MQTDYERYIKMSSLAQIGWWEADFAAGHYLCSDFLCDLLGLEGDTISFRDFQEYVKTTVSKLFKSSVQTRIFTGTFMNKPFPFTPNMVKSGCIPVWLFVRKVRESMAVTNLLELSNA